MVHRLHTPCHLFRPEVSLWCFASTFVLREYYVDIYNRLLYSQQIKNNVTKHDQCCRTTHCLNDKIQVKSVAPCDIKYDTNHVKYIFYISSKNYMSLIKLNNHIVVSWSIQLLWKIHSKYKIQESKCEKNDFLEVHIFYLVLNKC